MHSEAFFATLRCMFLVCRASTNYVGQVVLTHFWGLEDCNFKARLASGVRACSFQCF